MDTADPSARQERPRRPLLGLGVGIALAVVVAYPVFATGVLTLISFADCLMPPCTESYSQPWTGTFFGALTAVLVALPFTVGVAIAGAGKRAITAVAVLTAAPVVALIALSALD
ncbi:hypothetical protein [Haloechinothrix salitolerans]|uniref:Major facilitator superfamily (MFS) profile domain-containing protein n=1 Tax=Haloechinothrix salitolerans TaxID=926830 RepID=A0ABW2BXX9_9PSEU